MTTPAPTRPTKCFMTLYVPITMRDQISDLAAARALGTSTYARSLLARALAAEDAGVGTPRSDA